MVNYSCSVLLPPGPNVGAEADAIQELRRKNGLPPADLTSKDTALMIMEAQCNPTELSQCNPMKATANQCMPIEANETQPLQTSATDVDKSPG